MVTKDEAIKAAGTLKEWCDGLACRCCPFTDSKNSMGCIFRNDSIPTDWKLPKTCRWTDTDVELAKALKKAGADKVLLLHICECVIWESSNQRGCVPKGSFEALRPGESVTLDTIIQEAKED